MKLILQRSKNNEQSPSIKSSRYVSTYRVTKSKVHTCYYLYVRKKGGNGTLYKIRAKVWSCKACRDNILVPRYQRRLNSVHWDYLVTLTTRTKFLPPISSIIRTKKCLKRFLQSAKHKYGRSFSFFWAIGLTKSGRIHYHILWKGPKPSTTWVRKKWHKLIGCYIVDVRPALAVHTRYLIRDNAAALPDIYQDRRFTLSDIRALGRFRRVNHTRGLYPKAPKKKTGWVVVRPLYAGS